MQSYPHKILSVFLVTKYLQQTTGKTCVINTDLSIIIGQRLSEYLRDFSNDFIQPFHFMDK